MIGVSFQPGMGGAAGQSKPQNGTNSGGGVQEAIKVLSLRLPRVVGAQAISPQSLLESPGSQGSRVDSVVNQVLAKFFPGGGQSQGAENFGSTPSFDPNQGAQQPTFTPETQYSNPFSGGLRREAPSIDYAPFIRPRIVADNPDSPIGDEAKRSPFGGGGDAYQPPASIGTLPSWLGQSQPPKEPDRPYEI